MIPEGWREVKLSSVLSESRIEAASDDVNRRITVRLHLKGIEKREPRDSDLVGLTKYFERKAGQFVYGKQNLHNGAIALIPEELNGYLSTQDVPAFDIDTNIFGKWLFHFFARENFYKSLEAIATGTGSKRIQPKQLMQIRIQVPPLPEQRAIAEILDSVDAAISATEATLAQTRRVKQALLQQLLTKGIDENGRPHTKFKMTEIGMIPDGWEVCTAGAICETISVGIVVKPASLYVTSGVPCFRGTNIGEGFLRSREFVQISPASNELHRKSKLRKGDILVIRTGYPGTACVLPAEFDGANCIDLIFCRPKVAKVTSDFLCTFINSDKGKLQVSGQRHGLAQQHFNVKAMKEMFVALPPLEEQARILAPVRKRKCSR